jgi:hypothetical protein
MLARIKDPNLFNDKRTLKDADRIRKANLEYPVILSRSGSIIDGRHRCAKLLLQGKDTVNVIRLENMPEFNAIYEDWMD